MPTLSALLFAALLTSGAAAPSARPVLQEARFSWAEAKRMALKLQPRSASELERAYRDAKAGGREADAARAAAELCTAGRASACLTAEKSAGSLAKTLTLL